MCDTFIAMQDMTGDDSLIFGKNSDRDSNEAQVVVYQPRTTYFLEQNPLVKATFIQVPQVEETYALLMSKPSWMWGCEMGVNEFGVVIGNEAVFTKEKNGPPALTGMDLVRLALERCKRADDALAVILEMLSEYGQGGNCGYQTPLHYHNGFLIADHEHAWILETAGKFWAAKRVQSFGVISNGLSLSGKLDAQHPELVENAIKKGYCKSEKDFDFASAYASGLHRHFTKFKQRRCMAGEFIIENKGRFGLRQGRELLQLHAPAQEGKEFCTASMAGICMHAGGVVSSQTTSSMLVKLNKDSIRVEFTGSSIPCISTFKPFWFTGTSCLPDVGDHLAGEQFWFDREKIHRAILSGAISLQQYKIGRSQLQQQLDEKAEAAEKEGTAEAKNTAMRESLEMDSFFVRRELMNIETGTNQDVACGNLIFRNYWKKTNKNIYAGRME